MSALLAVLAIASTNRTCYDVGHEQMGMIVEQFLSGFHYGDAIGNATFHFHRFLQKQGIESRIVALTIDERLLADAVPFTAYRANPAALKILHFAVSSELSGHFRRWTGKKILIYHNITPARFFADYSAKLAQCTAAGLQEIKGLAKCFDLVVADSAYNAAELAALGFPPALVFPLTVDLAQYDMAGHQPYARLFQDERRNLLFVGRVTPNKKIEDLIKILFFYKNFISPCIRLIIVGNTTAVPLYYDALRDLAARFFLSAEDIVFTGHLPFAELLAIYRSVELFLSMSEHEGFCLPLIESCFFGIPVIAYAAGAVPETLAGAGLAVREKKAAQIALLAEQVLEDTILNNRLRELAAARLARYRQESAPEILLRQLQQL